jgi:ABC-type antimicrobial peptide transport system permease subunit
VRDSSPATLEALKRVCAQAAPTQNCEPMPLTAAVRLQRVPFLAASVIAAALGWTALAISCIGLYGLVSYLMLRRRREIGVRLALGASAARVAREMVAGAGRQVALGVAIGLPLAFALSRIVAGFTDRLHTFDLTSFVAVPAVLAAIALAAAWLPARRSAAIAPTDALRDE